MAKLTPSNNPHKGRSVKALKNSFVDHLEYSLAKDEYSATQLDYYKSLALTIRDRLLSVGLRHSKPTTTRAAKEYITSLWSFLLAAPLITP
jgi:starch phosphorylase